MLHKEIEWPLVNELDVTYYFSASCYAYSDEFLGKYCSSDIPNASTMMMYMVGNNVDPL